MEYTGQTLFMSEEVSTEENVIIKAREVVQGGYHYAHIRVISSR